MDLSVLADRDEFVLDIREIVGEVDTLHIWTILGGLNLGPSVDLNSHVLLHDVGVSISNGDASSLLHDVKLVILGDQDSASVFITNNAIGRSVDSSLVSSSLSSDIDRLDLEVHGHSGSWLQIFHGDESWLFQNNGLLDFFLGRFAFH